MRKPEKINRRNESKHTTQRLTWFDQNRSTSTEQTEPKSTIKTGTESTRNYKEILPYKHDPRSIQGYYTQPGVYLSNLSCFPSRIDPSIS